MKTKDYLRDISEIKQMMERSSRFISLSGLSGILAGTYALVGAYAAYLVLKGSNGVISRVYDIDTVLWLFLIAAIVLVLAIGTGMLPTISRTKKMNLKVWDRTSKRLAINLLIPLVTGGIFIIIIALKGMVFLITPLMLIFYGLALINASKYTLSDIRYLGLTEVVLGLVATIYLGYGLLFWAIGFGVLHIVYGIAMYYRYER
jgi:hypothetical protein